MPLLLGLGESALDGKKKNGVFVALKPDTLCVLENERGAYAVVRPSSRPERPRMLRLSGRIDIVVAVCLSVILLQRFLYGIMRR